MKKFLCLLTALTLLVTAVPALAELGTVGAPITYAQYAAALEALCTEYLGWTLEWDETEIAQGYVYGNMRMSPMLVLEGEYVAMVAVSFRVGDSDDAETLLNLFITVSTLAASAPAVAEGADMDATVNAVFADLSGLYTSLSVEDSSALGLVGGNSCGLGIDETEDGVSLTMFLLYETPAGN